MKALLNISMILSMFVGLIHANPSTVSISLDPSMKPSTKLKLSWMHEEITEKKSHKKDIYTHDFKYSKPVIIKAGQAVSVPATFKFGKLTLPVSGFSLKPVLKDLPANYAFRQIFKTNGNASKYVCDKQGVSVALK